jgi:hypothetical protein
MSGYFELSSGTSGAIRYDDDFAASSKWPAIVPDHFARFMSGRVETCYQVRGGFASVANPGAALLPKSYHPAVRR